MTDTYTVLDLETTGLNPKKDRIIEIGAVKVCEGKIVNRFQTLINPGRVLEERVCELTGICNAMLTDAPEIETVLEPLLDFIGEDILVGHRILFDYSFVKRVAVNQKLTFEKKGIDTLKLARKFLPALESRRLEYLCRYYDISHTAHRALGDAEATAVLYQRLVDLYYKVDEQAFMPVDLIYKVKKETPITKSQKERLYKLLDKHKISIDDKVDKLTRNEADRIMDQILAKYGR